MENPFFNDNLITDPTVKYQDFIYRLAITTDQNIPNRDRIFFFVILFVFARGSTIFFDIMSNLVLKYDKKVRPVLFSKQLGTCATFLGALDPF